MSIRMNSLLGLVLLFSSICIRKGNNFHAYIFGKPSNLTFSNCFRLLQTQSRLAFFFTFQLLTLLGATFKIFWLRTHPTLPHPTRKRCKKSKTQILEN